MSAKKRDPDDCTEAEAEACCQIVMTSDEFGDEYYSYDSLKEAQIGFESLKRSCKKIEKKDHIERTLRLVIREWVSEGY